MNIKKFSATFLLSAPLILSGAVEFDLRKGVDMTATNYRPASLYNQLVDNATIGATNKGGVIRQGTTPNTGDNPRYTNFLFISNSVVTAPTLMFWDGTGWIPASIGANSVGSAALQNSAVIAGKIAGSAVYGSNIVGNTIENTNLADNAISGNKIANGGVWQEKFAIGAIRGIDITNKTITYTNIADGTIQALQLANDAVRTLNITNLAVTTAKLALNAVTRDILGTNSIYGPMITNGGVVSNNIAAAEINPVHLSTNVPYVSSYGSFDMVGTTPTLRAGKNVSSVARTSAGRYAVTLIVAYSSTNYALFSGSSSTAYSTSSTTNQAAGSFGIVVLDSAGTPADPGSFSFQVISH